MSNRHIHSVNKNCGFIRIKYKNYFKEFRCIFCSNGYYVVRTLISIKLFEPKYLIKGIARYFFWLKNTMKKKKMKP